jgi:hypothetical protein
MRRKWWGSKFCFIGAPELITRSTNKIKSITVKLDLSFVFVKVVLGLLNKFYPSDRTYPVWQCWPLEAPPPSGGGGGLNLTLSQVPWFPKEHWFLEGSRTWSVCPFGKSSM